MIDTNLTSAFLCARSAIPIMKRQGHGRIINVGSISSRVPRPDSPAYTASKWGLDGLTRALAIDLRDHNIAVSIMHPGIVATELAPNLRSLAPDFAASPQDVSEVIVHMADMPDHLNFYEALVVQNKLPFLGRGLGGVSTSRPSSLFSAASSLRRGPPNASTVRPTRCPQGRAGWDG